MKLTECCPPLSDPLKDKVLSPPALAGGGSALQRVSRKARSTVILGYSNNLAAYSIHLDEGALRTARPSGSGVAVLRMGLPVAFLGRRKKKKTKKHRA